MHADILQRNQTFNLALLSYLMAKKKMSSKFERKAEHNIVEEQLSTVEDVAEDNEQEGANVVDKSKPKIIWFLCLCWLKW